MTHADRTLRRVEREANGAGGAPLDDAVRTRMEAQVGTSLAGVQVHTDPRANLLATELGASAFTLRDHVFFGAGMYAPGTPRGEQTLAHELTHVAQSRRDGHAAARGPATVAPDHAPAEVEAHGAARGARGGAPRATQTHAIHRQPLGMPDPAPLMFEAPLHTDTLDQFGFDKDQLTDAHRKRIPAMAAEIKTQLAANPEGRVTIVGYTDQVGTEAYNDDLGQRRADNVRKALADAGVPDGAMNAISMGKKYPKVETGKDAKPEGANRRVEVNVYKHHYEVNPSRPKPGFGTPMPGLGTPAPNFGTPGWMPGMPPTLPGLGVPGLPGLGVPGFGEPALPGPRAQKGPNLNPSIPPVTLKRIKDLGDLIAAAGDAATKDPLVKELRDLVAKITPFMSNDEAKKALDDAIKAGVGEGIKAALKAVLEAIAGPASAQPESPTGPPVFPKDIGEHVLKSPPIPLPF